MSPRASASLLFLGLTLLAAPALAQSSHHGGATRACVTMTRHASDDGRTVTFELQNTCDSTVEASLSWNLACGSDERGTTSEHHETIAPDERRELVASAAACGASGFSIDDVRWSWRRGAEAPEPSAPVATRPRERRVARR